LDVDYFPEFRKVAAMYRNLVEDANAELERSKAPEELRAAVASLFKADTS